ncbi:MAG TPA: TonB-dependent receptor, partial [Cytophagaceae bacterium]|nr:TonB-dependent receptor [Cytophagaceae bacterium]
TINFSTTVFNRNIHNWILWVPAGNYWVPENVLKVWSRGIENTIDLTLNIHQIKFTTGLRFDYILSTNEKVPAGSENQLGKQLIYVPQYKGGLKVGGIYHGYSLSYTHNYTGIVYTQADDAAFVNGYWLGNMIFSKLFIKGNTGISLLFKINNIWNKSYQVIAYRAMPGRNFEIGISIQLNKL